MPIEPEQDPTYLSFQRALGFDDADLRAVTARRKDNLARQWQYRVPELNAQHTAAAKGIDDNYLSRGAFTSGHRGADQGTETSRFARQYGEENSGFATQNADMDSELARQLATNQRRLAEEGMSARQRLALDQAAVAPARAASAPAYGGSSAYGGSAGAYGGSASRAAAAPGFDMNRNVSVDFMEYNLRDPNEIRALQTQLGVAADGKIGPKTQAALQAKKAVYFNDRPINQRNPGTWQ